MTNVGIAYQRKHCFIASTALQSAPGIPQWPLLQPGSMSGLTPAPQTVVSMPL